MNPTLLKGDFILTTSLLKSLLKRNCLVVFSDKTHSYIIKRVNSISKKELTLKSDNLKTDSVFCRNPINKNSVMFIVLFIIKRKYINFIMTYKNKLLFFI